jgi:hypothetical protein
MKKKKKQLTNPSEVKLPARKQHAKEVEAPVDEEKPFDFGGIPDRNLKKNLGCG